MKKTLLTLLVILTSASNALAEDNLTIESYSDLEIQMKAIESICPSCALTVTRITTALHQKCGLPLTAENTAYVMKTHPVYAFSQAVTSMISSDKEATELFYEVLVSNVSCWDSSDWIDSTRSEFKERTQDTLSIKQ